MSANSNILARHILSFLATVFLAVILFCVVPYIRLAVEYGPNPGPIADMTGIGFIFWFSICGILFFVIFGLIAGLSEFGRRVLLPRIHFLATTLLMSACFFAISFLIPFALLTLLLPEFSPINSALAVSIRIGPLGVVYWLVLNGSARLYSHQA